MGQDPEVADSSWEWQSLKPAIGKQMVEEKRFDEAVAYYDGQLKEARSGSAQEELFGPDPVVLYRGKAEALLGKGDLDEAIAALRTALDANEQKSHLYGRWLLTGEEAEIRERLAVIYDQKSDPDAAARERALAAEARREAKRRMAQAMAPFAALVAAGATHAGQLLIALGYALAALVATAVWRRRKSAASARKVGWSFGEVAATYLVVFLPPLVLVPACAAVVAYAAGGESFSALWLSPAGPLLTLPLLILLIRRQLAGKVWPRISEGQSRRPTDSECSRAAAALSAWLLLTAAIGGTVFVFVVAFVAGVVARGG